MILLYSHEANHLQQIKLHFRGGMIMFYTSSTILEYILSTRFITHAFSFHFSLTIDTPRCFFLNMVT